MRPVTVRSVLDAATANDALPSSATAESAAKYFFIQVFRFISGFVFVPFAPMRFGNGNRH
jgi:hypothetical protein